MILLKIAVCDDSQEDLKAIQQAVSRILFSRAEYEIVCYRDGMELVRAIEEGKFDSDLVLLDIHMKKMNGMDTAAYIRRMKLDTDIIFITVSKEHVYEGYTYKAYAYILKSALDSGLKRELSRYLDERQECPETLNVNVRGTVYQVPVDRILYFESNVRKILIHIQGEETLQYYGKLNELEEILGDKNFIRCHQSYLVNRKYITKTERMWISLSETQIPVSRKYWELLRTEGEKEQGGKKDAVS